MHASPELIAAGEVTLLAHALANPSDDPEDRKRYDRDVELYVPDLFYIECTNVLWKYVRRFGYSAKAAQQDVTDLVQLPLHVAPTADLAEAALALALEHGLTAYDAAYVALSQKLSLPLVTADEVLIRRLDSTGLDLRWLGEWPA